MEQVAQYDNARPCQACNCGCQDDGHWHWEERPWCPCIAFECPCVTDTPCECGYYGHVDPGTD